MRGEAAVDGERRAGWPQGITLAAQSMLPTMGVMLLVPVLPLLMREYGEIPGASYLIPSLLTVPALCIALFSTLAGFLGDKLGRRRILVVALGVYAAAGVAPFLLTGFPEILASRIVLGLCEAAIITLSATLMGDYFSGVRRDRWLGLSATFASVSAIAFAGLGGVLGEALGWRGPVLVYIMALAFVPAMLFLTWEPSQAALKHDGPVESGAFPWRHMAAVAAATFVGAIFFFSLTVQQGVALSALGLEGPQSIGLLSALASFGVPIGTLIFLRLSQVRTTTLLAVEFLLMGGAFVGISQATGFAWFTCAAFTGLVGAGMMLPTLLTWTIRGLSTAVRGRGTGVFQSTFALGQFASGLVISALVEHVTHDVLAAFGVLGVIGILLAALGFVLHATTAPPAIRQD